MFYHTCYHEMLLIISSSSWKRRVEEGVPQQNRRDRRWYDRRDAYKRRHWFLLRKNGVRFGAFSGVRRQSLAHSSCGDDTADNEDDEDDKEDDLSTCLMSTQLHFGAFCLRNHSARSRQKRGYLDKSRH